MPTARLRRLRAKRDGAMVPDDETRRALERYEQTLEKSRSAIWEVDAQGIFTYVSRSLEMLLGYTRRELVGSPRTRAWRAWLGSNWGTSLQEGKAPTLIERRYTSTKTCSGGL